MFAPPPARPGSRCLREASCRTRVARSVAAAFGLAGACPPGDRGATRSPPARGAAESPKRANAAARFLQRCGRRFASQGPDTRVLSRPFAARGPLLVLRFSVSQALPGASRLRAVYVPPEAARNRFREGRGLEKPEYAQPASGHEACFQLRVFRESPCPASDDAQAASGNRRSKAVRSSAGRCPLRASCWRIGEPWSHRGRARFLKVLRGKGRRPRPLGFFVDRPEPRLYDRVVGALRSRHYSLRTDEASVSWIRR